MLEANLNSKWTPALCGLVAFAFVWWMWGSLNQVAPIHDEAAYILQARIFAKGQLVAAGRPAPEFFEQYHTFVEPVVAAKYPPGFSLLMVPGIWLGLPGLVPALLVGASTALAFALARRLVNARVALLTAVLMNVSNIALRFNSTYSSEIATGFLMLVSWWALYEHWTTGRRRWLLLLAGAVGWGAITRPFSMLAFAIPTAVAALWSIHKHKAWFDILPSLAVVAAPIAFMLIFDARVIGDWKKTPFAEYARLYNPEDHIGFGTNGTQPARSLSAEQQAFNKWVESVHEEHHVENLRVTAKNRAKVLIGGYWYWNRVGPLLALLGLVSLPFGVSALVSATVLLYFAAYLLYAHPLSWPIYYLELQPALAFLTAAGAMFLARTFARFVGPHLTRPISFRGAGPRREFSAATQQRFVQFAYGVTAIVLLLRAPLNVAAMRRAQLGRAEYFKTFRHLVTTLPTKRAVVFVQYARGHFPDNNLVDNEPFASADVWIVHDRAADNARLMPFVQDRRAYLYSETLNGSKAIGHIAPLAVDNAEADRQ
jgi:4-amino-4-deoxy-L-arabinose transferase-like glycosyltransferase